MNAAQAKQAKPVALKRGFTLIELVFVIAITGILAMMLVPRFTGQQVVAELGYFQDLVASLRYAQKLAVSSGCAVRASVTSNGYALHRPVDISCDTSSFPAAVLRPDGSTAAGSLPSGASVSGSLPLTVVFRADGSTDLGADATLAIGTYVLTLHAASGAVQTQ